MAGFFTKPGDIDGHVHEVEIDEFGNGVAKSNGDHSHAIMSFQISFNDDHSHELVMGERNEE